MSDRLGFVLVREGKISQEQLFAALREQRQSERLLGEILIEQGVVTDADILQVIGRQYGICFATRSELDRVPRDLAARLDRSVAEIYRMVPVDGDHTALTIAMYNPENLKHLEEISFFAKTEVKPRFAQGSDVEATLNRLYGLAPITAAQLIRPALSHFLNDDDTLPRQANSTETPEARSLPLSMPRHVGPYRLLERINVGGMAEVFHAEEVGAAPRRQVAIKMLLPNHVGDRQFMEMFREEASIALRLNHPNIGRVDQFGILDDRPYLVMEFVEGCTLHSLFGHLDKIDEHRVEIAACIVASIADALHYAHQQTDEAHQPLNIVHRDISPGNVLISSTGAVKLIDFGIAKMLGSMVRTETGVLKGKLGYMSPEQLACRTLDHRTDQFALGIILHEFVTGKPLFRGQSDIETMEKQVSMSIPSARSVFPKTPLDIEEILTRALKKSPSARFPHCGAMRDALRGYLERQPTLDYGRLIGYWVRETRR